MPGNFVFGAEISYNLTAEPRQSKQVVLGSVSSVQLPGLEERLRGIEVKPVTKDDPNWNCQGWVQDAIVVAFHKRDFTAAEGWESFAIKGCTNRAAVIDTFTKDTLYWIFVFPPAPS